MANREPDFVAVANENLQILTAVLNRFERKAVKIVEELETAKGVIAGTNSNLALSTELSGKFTQALNDSGFKSALARIEKNSMDFIRKTLSDLSIEQGGREISALKFKSLVNANIREIVQVSGQVIDSSANMVIQKVTTANIAKVRMADLVKDLKKALPDNLKRYAKTYIDTGMRIVSQQAQIESVKEAGFEFNEILWDYVGAPLQSNSHPECIWALQNRATTLFTDEQRLEFETKYNPRYNCHHQFQLSSTDIYEYLEDNDIKRSELESHLQGGKSEP